MLILQRLRLVLLALLWPTLLLYAAGQYPGLLEQWSRILDIAALALAVAGGLTAAGFSLWRLGNAFLLLAVAGAGARLPELSDTTVLLPILAMGILPWLRERGMTGMPTMLSGLVLLILLALWLRGGTPSEQVGRALTSLIHWRQLAVPWAVVLAALMLAAVLTRLLVTADAPDIALTGALAAMLPVMINSGELPVRVAATAAGVLALWTGLLLHAWRMAYLDELTGLPNRRALEDTVKGLPSRWSLAMLDVDHFKKFNDKWGHDVGDQVLRRVAIILQSVGGKGRAYRYGGEEFTVIFPHDDLERASAAIETVRKKMANTPFRVRGPRKGPEQRGKQAATAEQRITVSAGLAAARGQRDSTAFKRADQALYKAKKQGRNRLVRAR